MARPPLFLGMLQHSMWFTDPVSSPPAIVGPPPASATQSAWCKPRCLSLNVLLVPLLPGVPRLNGSRRPAALVGPHPPGPELSNASMLRRLGALMVGLAGPIVALVLTSGGSGPARRRPGRWSLLMPNGLGMPAYLGRDVVVAVFYSPGVMP